MKDQPSQTLQILEAADCWHATSLGELRALLELRLLQFRTGVAELGRATG